MADTPVVNIGENSPEYVAYLLLQECAKAEKMVLRNLPFSQPSGETTRKWILDTYAECLKAVRGGRNFLKQPLTSNENHIDDDRYGTEEPID
jgi:hypothetical protein